MSELEAGFYWVRDSAGWSVAEYDQPVKLWRYRGSWAKPEFLHGNRAQIGPRILPPGDPSAAIDAYEGRDTSDQRAAAMNNVASEILEIMETYDQQQAAHEYGGTPGGLEHMGDVWSLLHRWRRALLRPAGGEG